MYIYIHMSSSPTHFPFAQGGPFATNPLGRRFVREKPEELSEMLPSVKAMWMTYVLWHDGEMTIGYIYIIYIYIYVYMYIY